MLFDWGAFSSRKQARLNANQAEAEYYYELALLLTDVADKYLNVLEAQDALSSIASELEAVEINLNKFKVDLQLTQITDLYQAQASLASVEAEQLRLESELRLEVQLRSVSGIGVNRLYGLKRCGCPERQPDVNTG